MPQPQRNPGEAPAAPQQPSREEQRRTEEELQKMGQIPGLKEDKLTEKTAAGKERSQSAKEIVDHLGKIQTMGNDELIQKFRGHYGTILSGADITVNDRTRLQEAEYERFKKLAEHHGEAAKRQIEELTKAKPSPSYTEALNRITSGHYTRVEGASKTAEIITKLDIRETNLKKLREESAHLKELKEKKEKAEKELKPYQDRLAEQKEAIQHVDETVKKWNKKYSSPWVTPVYKRLMYATILASALATGGGSILWLAGANVALGALAALSLKASGIAIAGGIAGTLIKALPLGAISGFWKITETVKEEAATAKMEKEKAKLGIDHELKHDIHHTTTEIEKLKKKNADHAKAIGDEVTKHEARRDLLRQQIEALGVPDTAAKQTELTKLQTELELVLKLITDLEVMKSLMDATQAEDFADKIGGADLGPDATLKRIRSFKVEGKLQEGLSKIAEEIDKKNLEHQKLLHEMPYQGKVKEEIKLLEDPRLLADMKSFVSRRTDTLSDSLEALKTRSPNTYQTLKALEALPKDNTYRISVCELLHFAIEQAFLAAPQRVVMDAFHRIKPERIQHYLSGNPKAISDFFRNPTVLPHPLPGQDFNLWIKDLSKESLGELTKLLERLRKNVVITRQTGKIRLKKKP